MHHLKLHTSQISLDLPGPQRDCALNPRSGVPLDPNAHDAGLGVARGIRNALVLSACLWLIVIAAVVFF